MKLKLIVLLVLSSMQMYGSAEDKIVDAIRSSDPRTLRQLLLPGFRIGKDEKKRYQELAKGITNKTYADQYSYSVSDLGRFMKAGLKCAGAAFLFMQAKPDEVKNEGTEYVSTVFPNFFSGYDKIFRHKVNRGILGFLGVWFAYSGLVDIGRVAGKKQSHDEHINALAVETIINRIPVCDTNSSGPTYLL